MKQRDQPLIDRLTAAIAEYERNHYRLLGISNLTRRSVLIQQMVESVRRDEFFRVLSKKGLSQAVTIPHQYFDPIKAAIFHAQNGNYEEAGWLAFLSTHFGRNGKTGWALVRDAYGSLMQGAPWTWEDIGVDGINFRNWIKTNMEILKGGDGVGRHFGNHRKYQSLSITKPNGTGAAIASYVSLIMDHNGHQSFFNDALQSSGSNPQLAFANLYKEMSSVVSFGRTAKFDYLTLVGKIGLSNIVPGSAFLTGATGPLAGARLLFDNTTVSSSKAALLDSKLIHLEGSLNIGMQAMEDSLCNWQKSPGRFVPFRG